MDDAVERLERLHAQDPNDGEVAARLKAALVRAGRREEVARRYRFAFQCAQDWDQMQERSPGVRYCEGCKRDVHFALSYADFERLAAKGHCLALRPERLPMVIDGLIDAPERGLVRKPGDPCLVEGTGHRPLRPGPVTQLAVGRVLRFDAPVMPRSVYGAPPPRSTTPSSSS